MGLRTWWLERKLERIDLRLRELHGRQKKLREQEAELGTARRRGLDPAQAKARERKIHQERERIAHDIARLHAEEDELKAQLRGEGVSLAAR